MLLGNVCSVFQEYKDYPVCLIIHLEKGEQREYMEISFDDLNASLTFFINRDAICFHASLCFYDSKDEDPFIRYLVQSAEHYSYRKKCWILNLNAYMEIEEEACGTRFYCYKIG